VRVKLSRRDALAALAGVGSASLAGCSGDGSASLPVDSLVALAETLYPSAASGHREFVETYVDGRTRGRPAEREALAETVADLNGVAREWYDSRLPELSRADRDSLLHEVGVETAAPRRDGTLAERVRRVVDDLLYAFYTSPTGGELVGTSNPPGYPGGTASYHEGR
jgi:hypothetical protein